MKRRTFLGGLVATGLGVEYLDNGSVDGSTVSGLLEGEPEKVEPNSAQGDFDGAYVSNSRLESETTSEPRSTPEPTRTPEPSQTTTPQDPTTEPEETTTTTDTPENDTTTPRSDTTTTPPPENTTTASEYPSELEEACDLLYLQKNSDTQLDHEDGTAIALDVADKEYRIFPAQEFPHNRDLVGLYDELEDVRGKESLPGNLGYGVRTNREEIFEYSIDAYDDMSDEEEWDIIFGDSADSC